MEFGELTAATLCPEQERTAVYLAWFGSGER